MVSFANERFFRSQSFLVDSGKKYFDGHASFNPNFIDKKFATKNKHIFDQKRGYGYWLWKPYIIRETLRQVKDGDAVFYIDSGNLIVSNPNVLIDICKKTEKGILLFENRDGAPANTIWKNYQWTKYDCFKKMNCLDDVYTQGNQVDGSYVLAIKNDFTMSFFDEYVAHCEDADILTDAPNKLGSNLQGFKDHRHDQSVLSLMSIREKLLVAREPSEWGNNYMTTEYSYPQIFSHHRGII